VGEKKNQKVPPMNQKEVNLVYNWKKERKVIDVRDVEKQKRGGR